MEKFHIRIVGGWCGNRMVMIRDNLFEILDARGYSLKIDQQSIWENSAPPLYPNLVLQLFPAFKPEELRCPSLNIRPFLKDLDHRETLDQIFNTVAEIYPSVVDLSPSQTLIE